MIVLLVTALACVPWEDADQFGRIRFDEPLRSTDPRLAAVVCNEGECSGADATGAVYHFWDGDRILTKETVGLGPSGAFRNLLTAWDPAREDELSAAVCVDEGGGVWAELALNDGAWTYAMKAQP